ncbi:MAG TPA: FecR domain-containing protein [Candidatus Limnocylindrales bacterium]|nr:FecR domain-containing protein [Candidatus Limnocylindrales bacterium]
MSKLSLTKTLALAACVVFLNGTAAAQAPTAAGMVTSLSGKATVARASLAQPVSLRSRDGVFGKDRISVSADSLLVMLLGGKTTVTARELSVLTISDEPRRSRVGLDLGKVAVDVNRSLVAPGETIELRTPNAVAAVRGTVFVVEVKRVADPASPGGAGQLATSVSVLKGIVDVAPSLAPGATPVRVGALETVTVTGAIVGTPRPLQPEAARQLLRDVMPRAPQAPGPSASFAMGSDVASMPNAAGAGVPAPAPDAVVGSTPASASFNATTGAAGSISSVESNSSPVTMASPALTMTEAPVKAVHPGGPSETTSGSSAPSGPFLAQGSSALVVERFPVLAPGVNRDMNPLSSVAGLHAASLGAPAGFNSAGIGVPAPGLTVAGVAHHATSAVRGVAGAVAGTVAGIRGAVSPAVAGVSGVVGSVLGGVTSAVTGVVTGQGRGGGIAAGAGRAVGSVVSSVAGATGGAVSGATGAVRGAPSGVSSVVAGTATGVTGALGGVTGATSGVTTAIAGATGSLTGTTVAPSGVVVMGPPSVASGGTGVTLMSPSPTIEMPAAPAGTQP